MHPTDRASRVAGPARFAAGRAEARRGQAMVEFAMVLLPLLLIVVGIIQLGLLFAAHVTLTNASREAARAATIHSFDVSASRSSNDVERCTSSLEAARQSFGILDAASPHFSATLPCPGGSGFDLNGDGYHDRWVNGDITLALCSSMATPTSPCPTVGTYCSADDPVGCLVQVSITYRSDIVVPFIGALLDTDANGRFLQQSVATMVMN